jgi:TRAP-type C4-dicarboxylate transport system substrate-binding protein
MKIDSRGRTGAASGAVIGSGIDRRRFLAAASGVVAALHGGRAFAQQDVPPLTIPAASWGSPNHVGIKGFLDPFTKAVGEKSAGRITVQHFPGGQIAQDVDMPVAIPTGLVKFGWVTVNGWSGVVPEVKLLDVPTGLTLEQLTRSLDTPDGLGALFTRRMVARGAVPLAFTPLGPPIIVTNKPVRKPSDLKGMRIRVYSEGQSSLLRAIGGAPTVVAFAEVYAAAQHGTIDGALTGFQGVASQRFYEVMKYGLVPASFFGNPLQSWVTSRDWLEALPKPTQTIIREAAREAEAADRAAILAERGELAQQYREKGLTLTFLEPSMPEWEEWRAAATPIVAEARKAMGAEAFKPVDLALAGK